MPFELSSNEIEDLLHQQYIGHLGCFAEQQLYIVPIGYAYDGEYIYAHSYAGTKIKMMTANPGVCFQVDNIDNMYNWRSVIAWGIFEEITDGALRKQVERIILNRPMPFAPKDMEDDRIIFFRIKITRKTGAYNAPAVRPHNTQDGLNTPAGH